MATATHDVSPKTLEIDQDDMAAAQWTVTKPSRSDEVPGTDQQLRIAHQVRALFDSMAPKRPLKPNRSEPVSSNRSHEVDAAFNGEIPELQKFQSLQSQSQAVFSSEEAATVDEEFAETQYYKKLYSIDKQHHKTGSGFIKVVKEESENGYDLQLQGGHEDERGVYTGFKSNPATNDWIPNVEKHQAVHVSSKPNRSESC